MHDYGLIKQNLLMELSNYETNELVAESGIDSLPPEQRTKLGAIPVWCGHMMCVHVCVQASTHLQTTLYVNAVGDEAGPCVELLVRTSNDTVVRVVMVFAEGVFSGGESHVL
jgi:Bardet-Biedl syndrome 2 protein